MPLVEAIAEAAQVKVREHITPSTSPFRGNPFGLTAREIEVLRLVTQGLTTLQIAERLIISPRTADAHLRSIYSKLGVTLEPLQLVLPSSTNWSDCRIPLLAFRTASVIPPR